MPDLNETKVKEESNNCKEEKKKAIERWINEWTEKKGGKTKKGKKEEGRWKWDLKSLEVINISCKISGNSLLWCHEINAYVCKKCLLLTAFKK